MDYRKRKYLLEPEKGIFESNKMAIFPNGSKFLRTLHLKVGSDWKQNLKGFEYANQCIISKISFMGDRDYLFEG